MNWVERYGALQPHSSNWIWRAHKHIREKNPEWSQGRAIATAKEAAEKMCREGDTNWPGLQQVNPGSRAEACAALAKWNTARARAKADNNHGINLGAYEEFRTIDLTGKRITRLIDLTT
jgi:hypothetical protein